MADSNVKLLGVPLWAGTLFDALNRCTPKQAGERRVVLPYYAETMTALPERAVLLNRNYKPLGHPGLSAGREWVAYEDHPEAHIHIELFKFAKPLLNDDGYFFDDNCAPWLSTQNLHEYREIIKNLLSPWIGAGEWS